MIKKFIEKIKNGKGDEVDMTNASRIIRREMKKNWDEGLEEGKKQGIEQGVTQGISQGISKGIAMMAKKLKKEMPIEKISQLTGLSEQQIENL